MTMTTRRGFTLVELLIGLILLTAVGAVTYQLLVNTQRVSRSQAQHIGMQDNGRSGALIIANELRELGYDDINVTNKAAITAWLPGNLLPLGTSSDLRAIGPDSLIYRAPRGLGYTCDFTVTGGNTADVVVYNVAGDARQWNAYRALTTTDSLMLFMENNTKTSSDDFWLTVGLTANQSAQNCPAAAGSGAGIRFRIQIPNGLGITSTDVLNNAPLGNPVRAFELMQMRSYASNGKVWLGMRPRPLTLGTTIEPVVGPLSGTAQGLTFTYRDANNFNTLVADNVRSVEIGLQPMSDEMVRTTGKYAQMEVNTVSTRVALRNALRP
jgi:prepilin-type N-terminal cleavage/methylation domain-containing protein